jgi:DHA2 family multidrug resistance protein
MASAYNQMVRQATMLGYKNAFALLSFTVLLLSPLVWIMRLPPKRVKIDPEQMAAH